MNNGSPFSNHRINLLLIINVGLLAYLTALLAGFSSLDDAGLMETLQHGGISLRSLFFSGGGIYFRPLAMITYQADYSVWGTNPAAFHAVNLIVHLMNASLVYFLGLACLPEQGRKMAGALVAALFFVVNPVNCEPVVWVSGRTDLLCCLFFLLCLLVLTAKEAPVMVSAGALGLFFLCSLFAKESSIAFLGILLLYLVSSREGMNKFRAAAFCGATLLGGAIYFLLRMGSTLRADKGIAKVAGAISGHTFPQLAYDTTAVLGFYLKKMVWPFPLNLAIQAGNEPVYALLGGLALVFLVIVYIRQESVRLPLLVVACGLVPPLLAYHGAIPWAPLAERYLYIPMTGFALLVGMIVSRCDRVPLFAPFTLVLALALATTIRVGLWGDPIALWHDTVTKSPGFPAARVIYAYELIKADRFRDAKGQLDIAASQGYEDELLWKCRAALRK